MVTTDALLDTVERCLAARAEQKRFEHQARKFAKEANMLEEALAAATEAAGGTLDAGRHVLGFEWKPGVPAYKSIAEAIVLEHGLPPSTLYDKVLSVAPRRVFVIA